MDDLALLEEKKDEFDMTPVVSDPTPFDLDGFVNDWNATQPIEKMAENRISFAKVLNHFADKPRALGYNVVASSNRATAGLFAHLDSVADYINDTFSTEHGDLFEKAAKVFQDNAAHWQKRVDQVGGLNIIDEIMTEAIGEAVPGCAQFMLDLSTGLTFSYMAGAEAAYKRGENPFEAGITEAAKTGLLGAVFKMMGPLKTYLKAPAMGTVFGLQEAESAPEGEGVRAFGKGFGKGLAFSLTSPGGTLGLNEFKEAVRPIKEDVIRRMQDDAGAVGLGPKEEKKPRKFLQTVEESLDTDPSLAEAVKKGVLWTDAGGGKIGEEFSHDYLVQPNAESIAKAKDRIDTNLMDAIDFVMSDVPVSAEKGATFIALAQRFQSTHDLDKAIQMIETYDTQLREAGRFIQAASLWSNLSAPVFIRWANKQLASVQQKYGRFNQILGIKPETFTLSKDEQSAIMLKFIDLDKLPQGLEKTNEILNLIDTVAEKVPPSVSEMFDAYRYQNMLSSPRTHLRNIGENIFNTFITKPIDVTTRGAIDFVQAGLFGKDRQAYIKDVPIYLKAAINAVPNAVHAFTETLKLSRQMELGKPELTSMESRTEFEKARAKQMPVALTVIQRFMEACDKFNMALIGAGEMAILKRQGYRDVDAYKMAQQAAETYLYRSKLAPGDPKLSALSQILAGMGEMIRSARQKPVLGTLSKWYVPFIQTPINKAIQMVEHSPLGLIRPEFSPESMAKILSGSIITALGAVAAYEGQTTWAPPSNKEEKEWFYATGRKPFSVKLGNAWVPFWYLGPFALAFGLPAAAKYYTEQSRESVTQDKVEQLASMVTGVAQFIGSQSSTQSIGAFFSALHGDLDFRFDQTTGFAVEQIIPAAGFVRYINTMLDPVYRHPHGFLESIEKDLPILSEKIEARMTPLLEESVRERKNYFLPYDVGTSKPEYEPLLPMVQLKARRDWLESKGDSVIRKLKNKEITVEESLGEIMKLMQAAPKVGR